MGQGETRNVDAEQLATLSVWAIPGVGPKSLETLRGLAGGTLAALLERPLEDWLSSLRLDADVREPLQRIDRLARLGETVLARCAEAQIEVAFPGDDAFPARLAEIADAPPLLFYRGTPGRPCRRVAMVGSRHPETGFLPFARSFAHGVSERGVGIISGAAEGVDRACHWGALDAGGETWAFLGSALDQLDAAQARLLPHFLAGRGIFYSELPPGVRASKATFPRRNRLISGSADAVLILRAGEGSGTRHTIQSAEEQGRILLALPGDITNPAASLCNALIHAERASLCLDAQTVLDAVGAASPVQPEQNVPVSAVLPELSAAARAAYRALGRAPLFFDDVLAETGIDSAALTSALCELELRGLVVQHPGKRYERI